MQLELRGAAHHNQDFAVEEVNCSEKSADMEADEIPVWSAPADSNTKEPRCGEQLSTPQKKELNQLLVRFRDTMKNKPVRTQMVSHAI